MLQFRAKAPGFGEVFAGGRGSQHSSSTHEGGDTDFLLYMFLVRVAVLMFLTKGFLLVRLDPMINALKNGILEKPNVFHMP